MKQPYSVLIVAALFSAVWMFLVQNDPFFWDTVQLASKHAHFFYENGLHWAPLPPEIDSGHPPLLGFYLAVLWSVFGKTLAVSHWAMWPFLTAIIVLAVRLGQFLAGEKWGWLLAVLLFADPVLAGQAALVSPDIIVAFGLLCAVYGIQKNAKWLTIIGVLFLCATSMRGMMVTAALAFWVLFTTPFEWKKLFPKALLFVPGVALGAIFLIWHKMATGWVGHFEGSTWSAAFERADVKGMARNVAVLGWRWMDMDRFVEWAVGGFVIWRLGIRVFWQSHKSWIILLVCLVVFLAPSAILYKNLSAHRYFLPVFAGLHFLTFAAIWKSNFTQHIKTGITTALAVLLLLGNLWIYPKGVSMDWDSTLAHWPYHRLRAEAVAYLDQQNIDFETVGTTFPNVNTNENLMLNGDYRSFADLDFDKNKWVMASNIFNDIDEPEYATLEKNWTLKKRWESRGVWIEIYVIAD